MERTLVILKPSAVKRGLVGEITTRFERVGLKIIGLKLIWADQKLLDTHYPADREEFVTGLGQRTLSGYKEQGLNPADHFKEVNANKIGHQVRQWLVDSMMSGPVMPMVLEGPHAISIVRKMVGSTAPHEAAPGTIRGDYSFDSPSTANINKRPINNLIHASGNTDEAEFEIKLWFKPAELHEYESVHHKHMTE